MSHGLCVASTRPPGKRRLGQLGRFSGRAKFPVYPKTLQGTEHSRSAGPGRRGAPLPSRAGTADEAQAMHMNANAADPFTMKLTSSMDGFLRSRL
jgi:hypothetical protein